MKKKQIETWKIAPYVIVSFAPFCLYIATYKHSYVHFWFVYRLLIAPMLCVWFIFMTIMGSEPKMDKMDKAVINSSSYDKNQL